MSEPIRINDGGPAFPAIWSHGFAEDTYPGGMSLRDYFAGQALALFSEESRGVVVAVGNHRTLGNNSDMVEREARDLAEAAYVVADAMLKAREAK